MRFVNLAPEIHGFPRQLLERHIQGEKYAQSHLSDKAAARISRRFATRVNKPGGKGL